MADTIIEQIRAAQVAQTDDYIAWAEITTGEQVQEIVLHTVRLPQSIDADTVLLRIQGLAEKTLANCGFSTEDIAAANLHITPLPNAEQTQAMLDEGRSPDSDLVLVDLVGWESIKHRFHLTPYTVGKADMEMDLNGLKIRRSIATD